MSCVEWHYRGTRTLFEDAFELLEHILRVLLALVLLELKTSAACSTQGTNTVAVVPIHVVPVHVHVVHM